MSDSSRFTVKFVGNTTTEGHTTYTVKVSNPDGDTWNIHKRYREIRELHEELRLRLGDVLPAVPGKRLFGNQDPVFILSRQEALQQYLHSVLQIEGAVRQQALKDFLGGPTPHGERNQARQYEQILDQMQAKLLNLALPPAPLDETEIAQRLKKYGQAMRLHVLSQPVDPIHLRAPGFDAEPVALCQSNGEQLEALKSPAPSSDRQLLNDLLDGVKEVLHPKQPLANKDRLIVPFPSTS